MLSFFLIAFAISAQAQVRLNFPRQLTAQELSTTGFALVNTSSTAATATFSFYGTDGVLIAQASITVPAKGQVARLASEIMPNANAPGWVQIATSSSELQGFELVGNFATVADGAGPAPEGRQLALIDFSREDTVHIVNTSSQSGTAEVTLRNAAGESLGVRSIPLAPFQPASLRLGDVHDDNSIDLVSLSADVNISAALTTKLPGGLDIGLTNAIVTSTAPSTLFLPFAPSGPQGASTWTTFLGVSNLAAASQSVSLTFTPDTGSPVTIQRTLAPGASVGDTVTNLFGISSSAFAAGWIRVNGTGALAGVAAYQDSANGSLAIVPSQSAGATAFFFGHIASLSPWYTGIALLNTTTGTANVEIYAIDSSGQLVGSVSSFSLAGGRRTSLLSEFVPQVLQRVSDGGWVFVRTTNNVPLIGFELFGHAISPILANVQGFALPAGSNFVPPGGNVTSNANVERASIIDRNLEPKGTFAPRETINYVATITNSGSRDSAQLTFAVTDPRNQTLFTNTTTITLPTGSADAVFGSFIPSNALNGQYTFTATLVHLGKTTSKSVAFTVTGGTSTPSVGQEIPLSWSTENVDVFSFRPGDTVRFAIPIANFTNSTANAVLNYQLTGPGLFSAGSGSLTFTAPTGISFQTIDRVIPANAQQGLFAFSSNMTVGGNTITKGTVITVVPKNASETVEIDHVFASDSFGVPRAGFTAGSNIILTVRRVSLYGVSIPASIRNTVTGPDGEILNQTANVNLLNGGTIGITPLALSATASPGTYTFQTTISYQDNNNSPKTASATATFVVGANPPPLQPTITTQRLYVADFNLIARTSFSNGEPIVLVGSNYSTQLTTVPGTALFQLNAGSSTVFGQTYTATFAPGLSTRSIALIPVANVPSGTTYTFALTATVGGLNAAANSTSFVITAPDVPPLTFGLGTLEGKTTSPGEWIRQVDEIRSEIREK